ncbi:MAG: translation initiation factor IF-1 [bacterium]
MRRGGGRGRKRNRTFVEPDSKSLRREEGVVEEALPALDFRVRLASGDIVLAKPAGKLRLYHIRIVPGDRVQLDVSDDGKRGRIVRRL